MLTKRQLGATLGVCASALILVWLSGCERKPVTLRVWQTETDPATIAVLEELVERFERQHIGIRVELENVAWGTLATRLVASLEAGNPPDVTHIQPFMLRSLSERGLLTEIDDVVRAIGYDDIYPAIRELHAFGGHYYGVTHAFNCAQGGYRTDLLPSGTTRMPETWEAYLSLADSTGKVVEGHTPLMLPGGDPLFIEFLLAHFVACNGGRLFAPDGTPTFSEPEVLEALEYFRSLAELCPPDWIATKYLDQFRYEINKKVAFVPFTGIRASKQFEHDAQPPTNSPETFAVMDALLGPHGKTKYGMFDGEPYVIFRRSRNTELAKDFLVAFFERKQYLKYCSTVPIHLGAIFKSMNEGAEYEALPFVQKWRPWRELIKMQISEGRVLPFFIASDDEMRLPFLLELQGAKILSDMVYDVTRKHVEPLEAARHAEVRAREIIERARG